MYTVESRCKGITSTVLDRPTFDIDLRSWSPAETTESEGSTHRVVVLRLRLALAHHRSLRNSWPVERSNLSTCDIKAALGRYGLEFFVLRFIARIAITSKGTF